MSEVKHTPGPWHRNIKPARHYPTIFAGRSRHIAVVRTPGLSEEEIEANCNLITAAPDLLEACKRMLDVWEVPETNFGGPAMDAQRACEAAIAKATG